jgi:uncharacterized protein
MMPDLIAPLALAILLVAFLYSSAGQAGASGFLAVMAFFGVAPDAMKPLALALNVLVAALGTWQFHRAGHFSGRLFWPLAALSVPAAFLGGYLHLPSRAFELLVGALLLASAAMLVAARSTDPEPREPSRPMALGLGAGVGFLSGLTGTGGGVILTPALLLMRWSRTKTAAAISAAFILLNSAAALLGYLASTGTLPSAVVPLGIAAGAGGVLGSYLGGRRLEPATVKRLLGGVLVLAGLKLVFAP